MARTRVQPATAVGVAEHGNSAELVTVARGEECLDRRRIDLTHGLPTHPYHHQGSWAVGRYLNSAWARPTSLAEAVAPLECVRESPAQGARQSLEARAETVPVPVTVIAIRVCAPLPPTTAERIADSRAANVADSVMYREALAKAAKSRGWTVQWYDRERVLRDAADALGREDIDAFLRAIGRSIGPPWREAQAGGGGGDRRTQGASVNGGSSRVTLRWRRALIALSRARNLRPARRPSVPSLNS